VDVVRGAVQEEVRPEGAEVEAHRAEKGELGVDHPDVALVVRHDRARVEVPVEEGLGRGHEAVLEGRDLGLQLLVPLEAAHVGLERRVPAVQRGILEVGVGKDEVLADPAELGVDEARRELLLLGRVQAEVARVVEGGRQEAADRLAQPGVSPPLDQGPADHPVAPEVLHGVQVHARVVPVRLGHEAGGVAVLDLERPALEVGPAGGEGPALPGRPDVGEGLLDEEAPLGPGALEHLEDEVEVAVADLGAAEIGSWVEEPPGERVGADVLDDRVEVERLVHSGLLARAGERGALGENPTPGRRPAPSSSTRRAASSTPPPPETIARARPVMAFRPEGSPRTASKASSTNSGSTRSIQMTRAAPFSRRRVPRSQLSKIDPGTMTTECRARRPPGLMFEPRCTRRPLRM
jgi:hypothetical protein